MSKQFRFSTVGEIAKLWNLPKIANSITEDIEVYINPRLRNTAGRVAFKRCDGKVIPNHIELHPKVVEDEAKFRETLIHEVAHCIAGKEAGHNIIWKMTAKRLGINPTRYHTYKLAKKRIVARKPVAFCGYCTKTIYRKYRLMKNKKYYHTTCGKPVKAIH